MGLTKPNAWMEAAICATCSGVCVRGFVLLGISRSAGQRSIPISIPLMDTPKCGRRISNSPTGEILAFDVSAPSDYKISRDADGKKWRFEGNRKFTNAGVGDWN